MFGLFSSSKSTVVIKDQVWMSRTAKLNACRLMARANPSCLFIAWFAETRDAFVRAIEDPSSCMLAENVTTSSIEGKIVIFAEHHPLIPEETALFTRLVLREVPVLSSLDEPFFEKFGGVGTIDVMKKLGMKEDEVIGHSMITKAIKNAQEKIGKKAKSNLPSSSQKEWMDKNL